MIQGMGLHQPEHPFYFMGNTDPQRTQRKAGQGRAGAAHRGAAGNIQIQLAQGPVVLAEKIIVVLPEDGMYLCAIGAAASLAAVAGDGGELLFQAG